MVVPISRKPFVDVHRVIQETVSYYARVVVLVVSDRSRVALETARLGARNPQKEAPNTRRLRAGMA